MLLQVALCVLVFFCSTTPGVFPLLPCVRICRRGVACRGGGDADLWTDGAFCYSYLYPYCPVRRGLRQRGLRQLN